ncbi:MAG TPA: S41 family peptidase [Steroidobacteraceae bacterium]|nr:S41 family peptidase [Steroidobacteraceae bacterium]
MRSSPERRLPVAAAACLSALMAACGGGGSGGVVPGRCSATDEKNFVLQVAREWYLFQELLPAGISAGDYATADELLDALTATARAQNRDRFFSFLTTRTADSSFLNEGQFIGFGFRTRIDGNRLLVPDVYEGSPAAQGGLGRGSEITHIDSGGGFVPVATILQTDPNLEQAFGPPTQGVQRGLRFIRVDGQQFEAVFTKAIVTIPPVPLNGTAVFAMPSSPNVPVGYVNLRTFISTAETPLRDAFQQFRSQGIQYFVVDLRYNGGGLVSIADLIGDLFGDNRLATDVFESMRFNASKSSFDTVRRFVRQPQSVTPVRIAFITTGGTASASELVVNSMKPWVEVAIVGSDTFGKPVGQSAFDLEGCETRLRLVTFRITNALNEGDYYDGLAPTLPFACAAADDLALDPWDSAESSTAAALSWLETGACGAVMGAPLAPVLKAQAGMRMPMMSRPTPAQDALPGLF